MQVSHNAPIMRIKLNLHNFSFTPEFYTGYGFVAGDFYNSHKKDQTYRSIEIRFFGLKILVEYDFKEYK